jgi:hypothetical protein
MGDTHANARLNVTSLALTAPAEDWAAHFKDANGTGEAWLAGDDAAGREYGIVASGAKAGGFFKDTDGTPEVRAAYTEGGGREYGVWARGNEGAHFESSQPQGGTATLATGSVGVSADGINAGGGFEDTNSTSWAWVASDTSKITGNGGVSFVQNHPDDPDQVIVYTAPEGDETGTYTRGSSRLTGGEARVPLGDTFKWVTNPDIGLTAHLTPRGDCEGLFVESLTTREIVVRELRGGRSNVAFDYIVHGLRIGFEEVTTVQEKTREARIPSMGSHREQYRKQPELRKYNALERFKVMRTNLGEATPADLSAAKALRDAISESGGEAAADSNVGD